CNFLVKPVAERWFMSDAQLAAERQRAHDVATANTVAGAPAAMRETPQGLVYLAWIGVGIPLLWGVWITLQKVMVLFR
ncbi:MAG TPA: MFS transporter, partial [Rhodanobacteraceae bacterium]|nr:MFS transporter [Rhodanobacteraceae bacterium]